MQSLSEFGTWENMFEPEERTAEDIKKLRLCN
jgi:hypothetical protein